MSYHNISLFCYIITRVLTVLNVSMKTEEGEAAIMASWISPPGRYKSGSFPGVREVQGEWSSEVKCPVMSMADDSIVRCSAV